MDDWMKKGKEMPLTIITCESLKFTSNNWTVNSWKSLLYFA